MKANDQNTNEPRTDSSDSGLCPIM